MKKFEETIQQVTENQSQAIDKQENIFKFDIPDIFDIPEKTIETKEKTIETRKKTKETQDRTFEVAEPIMDMQDMKDCLKILIREKEELQEERRLLKDKIIELQDKLISCLEKRR